MAQCANCASDNPEGASFCRQCGGELPHQDPLLGQEVLGRYRVSRLIGEGGMGRVYEAEQRVGTTTRRVAVKTLRPQLSADPQLARRFFREAETLVRLSHPNLIQFFDFGEVQNGMLAMVMEYIEGQSLAQLLTGGALEPERVDRIFAQICGALSEAHGIGIVHRDLKPDNILLTQRGGQDDFVKVLDFGIAKISASEDDRSTKLTQQGMMVGTPPYMSPEQFSGDGIDARSDIYSLGVIAYEMLTGRLPFDARTPWEWASKHLTAEPAPLRSPTSAGITGKRSQAIQRALAKRPDQRQQDVRELLTDFVENPALVPGLGTGSSPRPRTDANARPVQPQGTPPHAESLHIPGLSSRKKPLWIAAAAAGLVLLGGLGGAMLLSHGSQATPSSIPSPPPPPAVATPQDLPARADPVAPTPVAPVQRASAASHDVDPARPSRRGHERGVLKSSGDRPSGSVAPIVLQPTQAAPVPPREATRPAVPSTGTPIGAAPVPVAPARASAISSDPAAADLQARVDKAMALAPQRVETALGLYQAAAARYGDTQPALAPLRRALGQYGDARIRELLGAGRCAQAQAFYRALSRIGTATASRGLFGSSCPAP
ncbi:MAG: protein kinase [Myxococcales bacterium]